MTPPTLKMAENMPNAELINQMLHYTEYFLPFLFSSELNFQCTF